MLGGEELERSSSSPGGRPGAAARLPLVASVEISTPTDTYAHRPGSKRRDPRQENISLERNVAARLWWVHG